jgi:fido (protein-threonine AMPylation protein)
LGGVTSGFDPVEGETPIDPSDLKIKSIKSRSDLLPYEAKNILKATLKYLAARPSQRSAPFDYAWLLKLHEEMFGDVNISAGKARTRNLTIGIEWQHIALTLSEFVKEIEAFENDADRRLEQAVRIHHRAVQIHPFYDGNGRWSRMLANIWLRLHAKSVIEWPEAEVGETASSIRRDYIAAVQAADDYDIEPLTKLHRRYWSDAKNR